LAKNNYTHFTSPIRRYADLVVHRALAERESSTRGRPNMGQIASIAEHLSTTERVAAEAEMDSVKMKKMEFFQLQLDARDPQIFRALVLEVRNYGLLIELPDVLLTGLVHISSLTDDFYTFQPAQRRLVGQQSRRHFAMGDELRVFVARVDAFKRQVDFALAAEAGAKRRENRNDSPRPEQRGHRSRRRSH
jgi:ribonuclease R